MLDTSVSNLLNSLDGKYEDSPKIIQHSVEEYLSLVQDRSCSKQITGQGLECSILRALAGHMSQQTEAFFAIYISVALSHLNQLCRKICNRRSTTTVDGNIPYVPRRRNSSGFLLLYLQFFTRAAFLMCQSFLIIRRYSEGSRQCRVSIFSFMATNIANIVVKTGGVPAWRKCMRDVASVPPPPPLQALACASQSM